MLVFNATFLWPQRNVAQRNSLADFRSLFVVTFCLLKFQNSDFVLKHWNFLTQTSKTTNTHYNMLDFYYLDFTSQKVVTHFTTLSFVWLFASSDWVRYALPRLHSLSWNWILRACISLDFAIVLSHCRFIGFIALTGLLTSFDIALSWPVRNKRAYGLPSASPYGLLPSSPSHSAHKSLPKICLGFYFTKSRYSLHYVVVRLTFCSFGLGSLRSQRRPT